MCEKCKKPKPLNVNYEKTKKAAQLFGANCDKGCSSAWIFSIDGVVYDYCFSYSDIPLEAIYMEYISISPLNAI